MASKRNKETDGSKTGQVRREFAGKLKVARPLVAHAIPYYTAGGTDTEYLISNPNPQTAEVTLVVFGKKCKVVKKQQFNLKRNCTQSIRLQAIAPDHAGHVILASTLPLIAHILYLRRKDMAIAGGDLAGRDHLFAWPSREDSRTYGFGYRTLALGDEGTDGSVFVSNPYATEMIGSLAFYDQACSLAQRRRISVDPGCTAEYKFPKDSYGYGRIQVSHQAVINVLHFAAKSSCVAAAELLGESDKLTVPATDPTPGSKVLFDDTHGCRPAYANDWTEFENALVDAGYPVAHHTAASVTLAALREHDAFVIAIATDFYTDAEKQAISDFVSQGGGLLIVQDFGNTVFSPPTREILNYFGTSDDNNVAIDPTHHEGLSPSHVLFDQQRNFLGHPITNDVDSFHIDAGATLSGGEGWNTIVETDDDSTPPRRPVVMTRTWGQGRIVAFGDSNTWDNHSIDHLDNKKFGIRCAEWLLFRI